MRDWLLLWLRIRKKGSEYRLSSQNSINSLQFMQISPKSMLILSYFIVLAIEMQKYTQNQHWIYTKNS